MAGKVHIKVTRSFVQFLNSSTAGTASITNESNLSTYPGQFGTTRFEDDSSAASATITNVGVHGGTEPGSRLRFLDAATGGSAVINNLGSNVFQGGNSSFEDMSTAGGADIVNFAGLDSDGGKANSYTPRPWLPVVGIPVTYIRRGEEAANPITRASVPPLLLTQVSGDLEHRLIVISAVTAHCSVDFRDLWPAHRRSEANAMMTIALDADGPGTNGTWVMLKSE